MSVLKVEPPLLTRSDDEADLMRAGHQQVVEHQYYAVAEFRLRIRANLHHQCFEQGKCGEISTVNGVTKGVIQRLVLQRAAEFMPLSSSNRG